MANPILEPLTVRELIALLEKCNLDDKITLGDGDGYCCDLTLYAGDKAIAEQSHTNSTGGDNVYGLFDKTP